jgi:cation:H+ antiporter
MVKKRTIVAVLLLFSLVTIAPVLLALLQAGGSDASAGMASAQQGEAEAGEEESEGGIEGAIEVFVDGRGLAGAGLVLLGGVALLTAATEKLISYLVCASLHLRMSLFALAIVFTGFEFDDAVLAVVLSAGDLEGAALGTALGTGLAIIGITLALAAIVKPFPVDLPADYVVLFVLTPLLLVPIVLVGTLTLVHGVLLIGVFALTFLYLILREHQRDSPVFRSTDLGDEIRADGGGAALPESVSPIPEDRLLDGLSNPGVAWIGLSVVALTGIVFASMLLEAGSEIVIEGFDVEQTVFGATILTVVLTFEDIMLTIEPVRRGVPEIGIGNVIGSVLFSVTGNIGVIMLFSELQITPLVLTFHLLALVGMTSLAGYFLYRGELKRWHGYLLGGLYATYWLIAILVLGGVPISG